MHVGPRDPAQFVAPDWGRAVTTIGPAPYVAFVPTPLPRTMSLDTATISALSHADSSLGRLAGTGQLMPNPHLLLIRFARREALSSSRIEGTQASLSDVFEAEAGGRPTEDVREVTNYTAAMDHGLARLDTLPVSSRLLCEMHAHTCCAACAARSELQANSGAARTGSAPPEPACRPPPFSSRRRWMTWSLRCRTGSATHTIHRRSCLYSSGRPCCTTSSRPFTRSSTATAAWGACSSCCSWWSTGRSRLPLLPLSPYFERHRGSYYRHLQQVREQGQVQEWLRFFLRAVTEQATDAVARARRLLDLREDYRQALRGVRSRATDAVDLLFASPVLTRRRLATELGVTVRTATKVLRQLTELGALREVASGQGALSRWYADEILAALED